MKEPSVDTRSDEALIAAHVGGDQRAFELLADRYAKRVYAICRRYFGNPADAEDAAQEAFLTLLRRAESFSGRARFSTWMYRVTTNACNDLARKRARRPQVADADVAVLADDPSVDDVIAARELRLELRQALAVLDRDDREAVVLHDVLGLRYADVAARLGIPVGTAKSRIHRAHARLAQILTAGTGAEPSAPPRPPTAPRP